MSNWKLKCCPRCGGDVFMDTEESDWFAHCLQCGFTGNKNQPEPAVLCLKEGRPTRKVQRRLKHDKPN